MEPLVSLEMIDGCDLKHADSVIDVGGGASVLVDHLLQQIQNDTYFHFLRV